MGLQNFIHHLGWGGSQGVRGNSFLPAVVLYTILSSKHVQENEPLFPIGQTMHLMGTWIPRMLFALGSTVASEIVTQFICFDPEVCTCNGIWNSRENLYLR